MPFRQLPNTDAGRLNALRTARSKRDRTPAGQRPFSEAISAELTTVTALFEAEVGQRTQALAAQGTLTSNTTDAFNRTRQIVSHFFITLQNAIKRGVFAPTVRAHYGLGFEQEDLPTLSSEDDVITWAGNIAAGEAARANPNSDDPALRPLAFPSAAEVAEELAVFVSLRDAQDTAATTHDKEQNDVVALRPRVDALIREVWEGAEFFHRNEAGPRKRRLCRRWGVVYALRPGEPEDPADPGEQEEAGGTGGGAPPAP